MSQQPAAKTPERLMSLDAYRGFTMLMLVAGGFGLRQAAENGLRRDPETGLSLVAPDSVWHGFWEVMNFQFRHVDWLGCSLWDLVQPSFMFLVGTSMAYSYAKRAARGDSYGQLLRHAIGRAVILVLLGVFLRSSKPGVSTTYWTFEDVLSQIGLGYVFLFLLWNRSVRFQWIAAAAILVGYWVLFALWPVPADFDYEALNWQKQTFEGFWAHWNRGTNAGAEIDLWFWERFPESLNHVAPRHEYATLNFVPSLATMIFGLLVGGLLRSERSDRDKLVRLVVWGLVGVMGGLLIQSLGICPIVKKAWTPSWAIYSSGWATLFMAAFFAVIEMAGYRRWAFPSVVIGMNPITAYVINELLRGWIVRMIDVHTRYVAFLINKHVLVLQHESTPSIFEIPFGPIYAPLYAPILQNLVRLTVVFLILLWMYRRKIFIRI
ncbi:MAG: DUF5009 domain-containing protein [Planctomycetota bacterium]|nr:MAG: DUF5009 domain-containing protein [Planctomycetota bacterium]